MPGSLEDRKAAAKQQVKDIKAWEKEKLALSRRSKWSSKHSVSSSPSPSPSPKPKSSHGYRAKLPLFISSISLLWVSSITERKTYFFSIYGIADW